MLVAHLIAVEVGATTQKAVHIIGGVGILAATAAAGLTLLGGVLLARSGDSDTADKKPPIKTPADTPKIVPPGKKPSVLPTPPGLQPTETIRTSFGVTVQRKGDQLFFTSQDGGSITGHKHALFIREAGSDTTAKHILSDEPGVQVVGNSLVVDAPQSKQWVVIHQVFDGNNLVEDDRFNF